MAQLAISMKGQVQMLQEGIITKILKMLDDDMVNVVNAAGSCIYKICTLYMGVYAATKQGVHSKLFEILVRTSKSDSGENVQMKRLAAETLLQIYTLNPDCEKCDVDALKNYIKSLRQKKSADFVAILKLLYRLLDLWGLY